MTYESASHDYDFTKQTRVDRLSILWKVTVGGAGLLLWLALIMSALQQAVVLEVLLPIGIVIGGSLLCGTFLRRGRYDVAGWVYTLGIMAAVALMILPPTGPSAIRRDLIPFILPIVILLVGLLLSARSTLIALALALAIVIIIPSLGSPFRMEGHQAFAVVLILVAAGLALQTAGEIYGIAEWALASYGKERKIKEQLFDTQEEVQRSYIRQKVLADDLKQLNFDLEAAKAAAIEAKNFRGQFLANMSHELRTPLNAIIGFSETMLNFPMMYNNTSLPDAYRTDLTQIFTSGKHLLQLINDILDLSRVDAGKLDIEIEPVSLDTVFRGVLETAQGLVAGKPIQIKRETPSVLPDVLADPLRIRQVILNLMSNASKFTDSGEVTLGARDNGDGNVLVWIRDTGIGIAPQDIGKIWEEFRQGSAGRQKGRAGSGLGLAISKQLLNLMNGKIWAESELGKGSVFYFTLPIYQPEAVAAQQG
ncbi:MAG TPA: HAMP domain-containing sensor histidine kinase [Aggregatilineales bacterium]|nr:HAMP domain-containing histidine kinase [Anaerolineales bacterium]HRE49232.1 HAMP domain-containing sensor histidine kinase [Aggregatilineales bacterium]